jgi:hypothetical protein
LPCSALAWQASVLFYSNAKVEFLPAMRPEDLAKAAPSIVKKYA